VADLSPHTVAWLALAALVSGFVDAIAGGGGAITVPALLAAGLPAHLALGTNKGQAIFGSTTALWRYARAGLVHGARARVGFAAGLGGAVVGARLVLLVPPETLRPIVLVLLVAVAVFFALRGEPQAGLAPRPVWLAALVALAIGAYDGFFGPGTGVFLILAFVWLFGSDLQHASADAKVVNCASNLGAVLLFASQGTVVWRVALPMAAAQALGAWLGAHSAIRGGNRWVRVAALAVVLGLVLKLTLDLL
jgi:uncharacterized membrane protein YfcA